MEENRLKSARIKARKNQQDAADALGASIDKIWRIEKSTKSPTIQEAKILADLYKTTVAYLSGETDNPSAIPDVSPKAGNVSVSSELPINEPSLNSDVFATLGILINQLEKTYPNMTEEDQKLTQGLLSRCMRIVCSDLEKTNKREVF